MRRLVEAAGREALAALRLAGALSLVAARGGAGLARLSGRELARELVLFGYGSLPLALVTAAITGATVVVQTTLYVQRYGTRTLLGWAAGFSVLWEFGPLLLGLLMAARLGARNAAELATMQVGGQLEGLEGVALDPYALLVAPRLVATVVTLTGLSTLVFTVAILCEALAALLTLGLPLRTFFDSFAHLLAPTDVLAGVVKCAAYGVAIALVSTAAGLAARGGARAVGQAAARAVVHGCAAIFLLDFLLSALLLRLLG